MTAEENRPRRPVKTINYEESSDEDAVIDVFGSTSEDVSDYEVVELPEKRPAKGSTSTFTKKKKSIWPEEEACVYAINQDVSSRPNMVSEEWNQMLLDTMEAPIDYYNFLLSGNKVVDIVQATNNKMYGTIGSNGFTNVELRKYVGNYLFI